jgi:hypothetical protein
MVKCQTSLKNLLLFQLSVEVEGMQQVGFQNEMNAENGKLLSLDHQPNKNNIFV